MKNIKLVLIAFIICFSVTGCGFKKQQDIVPNDNNIDNVIKEEIKNEEDNETTNQGSTNVSNVSLKINQAQYNNVVITIPATKESFNGTNWTWDSKYAKRDLATGYTTSGGRIGSYPGGVVVGVINVSGQTKKIEDCTIDSATFYNPNDGSENVYFIGGINYTSTENDVTTIMSSLGYKNAKVSKYDNSVYYRYFANDDQNNYKNYIEIYFYNSVIKSVTVRASI